MLRLHCRIFSAQADCGAGFQPAAAFQAASATLAEKFEERSRVIPAVQMLYSLMPFANVIPVPRRNAHRHIALHNRLAPQTRIELEVGSLFHAVELIVIHLGKIINTLFHDDMASSAGAAAAACVLQVKTKIHSDIEQRLGLAVILIRQLAGFKLESLVGG
jgi:hypothetical protein